MGECYLLEGQTLAGDFRTKPTHVIKVPQKSLIEVPEPLDGQTGLIEVTLNGDIVLMFAEDIRKLSKRCSSDELKGREKRFPHESQAD